MDQTNKVAVIVPIYRKELTGFENLSLNQCFRILGSYPVIAVVPDGLEILNTTFKYKFHAIITFNKRYFIDRKGYNSLMLDAEFYKAFLCYEHILIHQLDAFVFSDELSLWSSLDYDYIGAPWIRKSDDWIVKRFFYSLLSKIYTRFNVKRNGLPSRRQFEGKVGNGGFSLRRVQKFYELTLSMQSKIADYLEHSEVEFHEDAFWSIEVNRKRKNLNIPDERTGVSFAFELHPERALALNNNKLPFGCHAWDKNLTFWKPFFATFHVDI